MSIELFFLMVCTFAFFVVSVALAAKFVLEAYLEYIQVLTGIRVVTKKQQEEAAAREENLDDFDDLI